MSLVFALAGSIIEEPYRPRVRVRVVPYAAWGLMPLAVTINKAHSVVFEAANVPESMVAVVLFATLL